jgi:hypothetical protein
MAKISNFREWTEKVRRFTEGLKKLPGIERLDFKIKPPSSARKLAALAEKWPRGLPAVLRDFWSTGSAEVCCLYTWEPEDQEKVWGRFALKSFYGGIHFGTQNVYPGNSGADPRDENMRHVLGKEGQELLCRSALFHMFGDGDCLGFDPTVNYDDPAVVYLVHDDKTSTQVAPTFTEFLSKWSKVAFLWPVHWGYGQWPFRLKKAQKAEVAALLELASIFES